MRAQNVRIGILALALLVTLGRSDAFAWGCEGHQAIAILAEQVLGAASLQGLRAVLSGSPVDPSLRRGCLAVPSDIIADAATWADDQRAAEPSTSSWHFVNLPLSLASRTANPAPFCVGGNCVIDAITKQFQTLKSSADRTQRANALRFIIHFVGDIHQPLHVVTNGDRGGNCFPVTYFARSPEQDDRGGFSPNLHAVWDSMVIATLMKAHGLSDARALAAHLAAQGPFPKTVTARVPTTSAVTGWAREAHALARSIAYGRLPVAAPTEPAPAITLSSCQDNHDVAHRMLALHEGLAQPYEQASETAVAGQLRLAGTRLAAVLKSVFPGP
ncbi:MAG: S1/P1 nuclease [Acidobacteriota bacterium]